jgi:hypothetical protein
MNEYERDYRHTKGINNILKLFNRDSSNKYLCVQSNEYRSKFLLLSVNLRKI